MELSKEEVGEGLVHTITGIPVGPLRLGLFRFVFAERKRLPGNEETVFWHTQKRRADQNGFP